MHIKFGVLGCIFLSTASAQSVLSLLSGAPNLTTLGSLVSKLSPDLANTIANNLKNVTLLAPNDQAFQKLNSTGALTPAVLTQSFINNLLSYHVLNGTVYAANISTKPQFPHSFLTNTTYENVTGGQVVEPLLINGQAGFVSGLKKFAPVVQADIKYDNGIIHILDEVLTIPEKISETAANANLTALVDALKAAQLVSTVDSLSDITVFAPSNTAFQAIASTAANLTTQQLTDILEYHVIKGTVAYSSTLKNGSVPTLNGKSVNITVGAGGAVTVNGANVVTPDVLVANGVVHVIDSVLIPANSSSTSAPTAPGTSGTARPSATYTGGVAAPTGPGVAAAAAAVLMVGVSMFGGL